MKDKVATSKPAAVEKERKPKFKKKNVQKRAKPRTEKQPKTDDSSLKKREKRKKNKSSSPNPKQKTTVVLPAPARDFCGDLISYLSDWSNRPLSGWKFNKILQTWALDHCLDEKRVDSSLFELLIPYLQSIQGGAKDRLLQAAAGIIQNGDVQNGSKPTQTKEFMGWDEDNLERGAENEEEDDDDAQIEGTGNGDRSSVVRIERANRVIIVLN